jgi:hypothetical protein
MCALLIQDDLAEEVSNVHKIDALRNATLDRACIAARVEARCSERGHPPSSFGECHCGCLRYD